MANPHGTPIWYELATPDPDAAQAFYADVVGWTIAPTAMTAAGDYRILTAPDGQGAGGLMKVPEGMAPGWYSYIGVDDVDASAAKVKELGGRVWVEPQDIPGVGRFAFVTDPQGMGFYVMRGASPEDSAAFSPTAVGHCSWNELVTSDKDGALSFYGAMFGWENRETMPMGELGGYHFLDLGEVRLGAMMQQMGEWPTRWTYYIRVPSVGAAMERIAAGGGQVHFGPQEVPGGDHIVLGGDPQGVAFALVGGM